MEKVAVYGPPERLVEVFTIFDLSRYNTDSSPPAMVGLKAECRNPDYDPGVRRRYSFSTRRDGVLLFSFMEESSGGAMELGKILPAADAGIVYMDQNLFARDVDGVAGVFFPTMAENGYHLDSVLVMLDVQERKGRISANRDRLEVGENADRLLRKNHRGYSEVLERLARLRAEAQLEPPKGL